MKRNYAFGVCGMAAIAIVTAALLRPGFAQSVEDDNPFDALPPTPSAPITAAPSTGAPPAATPGMPAANTAPAAGGGAFTYGSAGVPTAPEEIDPFGAVARRGNSTLNPFFSRGYQSALQQLAVEVRGAKDDAARDAATQKLQQALTGAFDADMKQREQELTQLEERLKALRQQMTRRQEKKGEIIELQSRVLLNEADGLGFYSTGEVTDPNSPFGGPGWGARMSERAFRSLYGAPAGAANAWNSEPVWNQSRDPGAAAAAPAGSMMGRGGEAGMGMSSDNNKPAD